MMSSMHALRSLVEVASRLGDEALVAGLRLLAQRVRSPSAYVVLVGETSTGKSTLINGLLGAELLPSAASPTTGTVTQVLCRPLEEDRRLAVYRNATQEELSSDEFARWSAEPPAELLKLQLHTGRAGGNYDGFQVFDTPGYNALVDQHEEVLLSIVPDADVLVVVAGYRSGFGQADQDLYEDVRSVLALDEDMPVLLVINRTREGTTAADRRVKEIVSNASDSLRRDLTPILVSSAPLPRSEGEPRLPDTERLWDEVHRRTLSQEVQHAVERRLHLRLLSLAREVLSEVEVRVAIRSAGEAAARENRELLVDARGRSEEAVDTCFAQLGRVLPRLLQQSIPQAKRNLSEEIEASGKWLGHSSCAAWLHHQGMPAEVRAINRSIEDVVVAALDELNRTLDDIANTAVERIERAAALRGREAVLAAQRLGAAVGQRVAGEAALAMFRGMGGVGGAAAGAGNMVKMVVSRVGRFFGKRFSRDVYTRIGKVFTKKFLQRAGAAIAVIIEVGGYLIEVQTWQRKMTEDVDQALAQWGAEMTEEHLPDFVEGLREENLRGVAEIYDGLISSVASTLEAKNDEAEAERDRQAAQALRELIDTMESA